MTSIDRLPSANPPPPLEMWGGIECTRNRVGDRWFDQLEWSGHDRRPGDLANFARLGIRVLRYPFLWERAQKPNGEFHWDWADDRLERLKRWGITPIAGLVHHGSGPAGTDLLDPGFASGLAIYAEAFAQRFPDVRMYTPVNEPLTTARFSALYGHWYPHLHSDRDFASCLLNQCRAVILAMQAIRRVQPDAILIQTEDIGWTQATPGLQYQADFENNRRWLTFDLLAGRVDRHHPIGDWLRWLGTPESELDWFLVNRLPPDILGINYYITSERFLDSGEVQNSDLPPGGNGIDRYTDRETVQAHPERLAGIENILRDVWERYSTPLAITECHLGCTRDEQLRWLWQVWQAGSAARRAGVDLRAVTAWALLGSFDWDSLVTQAQGHYEVGAFDVRDQPPRPTALAHLIRQLASGEARGDSVYSASGWWQRAGHRQSHCRAGSAGTVSELDSAPILVLGARGTLGQGFLAACQHRNLPAIGLTRQDCDVSDWRMLRKALGKYRPRAIVNATGFVDVDGAERDGRNCLRVNRQGTVNLARYCRVWQLPLICFSSDLVFDGRVRRRYRESDLPHPLNNYGHSKAQAEREALAIWPQTLMVRTSAFFSPYDAYNFAHSVLVQLEQNEPVFAAQDVIVSPTYVPHLVDTTLDLLLDSASGIWHLANDGELSWFEFALAIARGLGLDTGMIQPRSHRQMGWIARRPVFSAMASQHGKLLPNLDVAIGNFSSQRSVAAARAGLAATSVTPNQADLRTAVAIPLGIQDEHSGGMAFAVSSE